MDFTRTVAVAMAAATLLLSAHPAQADAPVVLNPITPWNADWNPTTCTLARGFGSEQDPFAIRFEKAAPGDGFQLVLISKWLEPVTVNDRLEVRFGPYPARDFKGKMVLARTSSDVAVIFLTTSSITGEEADDEDNDKDKGQAPKVTPDMEKAADSIVIATRRGSVQLATNSLAAPFAALRACTVDLVKQWGLDPAEQATLRRHPVPKTSPAHWIAAMDYPTQQLRKGQQAIIMFRLMVDAGGKPSDCAVLRAYSQSQAFGRTTCDNLMKRAKFEPAFNANGQAVPSFYVNTVRFIIP